MEGLKTFTFYAVFLRKLLEDVPHQNEKVSYKKDLGTRKQVIQHKCKVKGVSKIIVKENFRITTV